MKDEANKDPEKAKAAPPPAPPDPTVTLEDLREFGAIAAESTDGAHVDVVTKGGVALCFPGDEKKAATLTEEQLMGKPQPAAAPKPAAKAAPTPAKVAAEEDLSDLPKKLREAMRDFGLKREHVLGHRFPQEGEVVIVTRGGRKLFWPADKGRVLTDMEKGDDPGTPAPRFFPEGVLDGGRKRG